MIQLSRLLLPLPLGLIILATVSCGQTPSPPFDLVIVNGTVIDGSGTAGFPADVGIRGDTIASVGSIDPQERQRARALIDASELIVSPGFIDIHTHSDWTLLYDGTAQSKIRQGVTTEVLGESLSAGPFGGRNPGRAPYGLEIDWQTLGGYFNRLERGGISVNVASFVGATQVRLYVMGEESRDPSAEELASMKGLVTEAMEDGAFGLSTALLVPPNTYHTTDQLVELASAVRPYGGIFSIHIRSEGEGIEQAIAEAIDVGERAGVPVDIIHLKVADRRLWGTMPRVCSEIEEARQRGLAATANQYPYVAGQNNLDALIPPWAMEGGREAMLKRLADPVARDQMEQDVLNGIPGWFNHYLAVGEWTGCQVASVEKESNKRFEGRSVAEIAAMTGKRPLQAVFDLLADEGGSVPAVYFLMSEEDVRYAMKQPWVSFGSDGTAVRPDGVLGQGKPHPRWYGTFPRILGKYVREENVISLEEAIRKMTSLNARKLGISDRGTVSEGMKADLTLFDPLTVRDRATFSDPHQYPAGIAYVVVNGVVVLQDGAHLGAKPGKVLRKQPPVS